MTEQKTNIADKVFSETSKARKSYHENEEKWNEIFKIGRHGNEILILLNVVYDLIPNEYRYYPDGYGEFFSELGFNVELPSRAIWYGLNIKMIKLFE